MNRKCLALSLAFLLAATLPGAHAASLKVRMINPKTQRNLGAIHTADSLVVTAAYRAASGAAVRNTIRFRARLDGLTATIAWIAGSSGDPIRLIGVNVDLVDDNNQLVASDVFAGLTAGVAVSTLTVDGLTPGAPYRLVITGTAQGTVDYTLAITTR